MLPYLLQAIPLGLSAAASPGPFQAFIIAQTLRLGWRRTIPAIFAPLISDGPIILLMVLLLTRMPPVVLNLIRIAGGIFVIYLAWGSLQAFRRFEPTASPLESNRTLAQAVMTNFLSPGPYIFWSLLAGPILVKGWAESATHALAFLIGFYVAMLSVLALIIIVFSSARRMGAQVTRFLLGASAVALFVFGLYQLYQAIG